MAASRNLPVLVLLVVFAVTFPAEISATTANNVLDTAAKNGAAKFASMARKSAWLKMLLESSTEPNGLTVFAFSDKAYDKSSAAFKQFANNTQTLEWALEYHVSLGAVKSCNLRNNLLITSTFPTPPDGATLPLQYIRANIYPVYENETISQITTASGATISIADRKASNGIVHILDKVMFPIPTGDNIDKYLMHNPNFSTLYMYLKKANLTMALKTMAAEPLTIFAPNNEAFTKIPKAVADKLKNVTFLQEVLEFHVVSGAMYSAGLHDNQRLHTLLAKHTLLVERGQGGVYVQNTHVIQFDTTVNNGVVHMLAGVMIPV